MYTQRSGTSGIPPGHLLEFVDDEVLSIQAGVHSTAALSLCDMWAIRDFLSETRDLIWHAVGKITSELEDGSEYAVAAAAYLQDVEPSDSPAAEWQWEQLFARWVLQLDGESQNLP